MAGGKKLRWEQLTDWQKADFGNGCGPHWLPAWLVKLLFGWFFEASCRRHDFAYSRGGDEADRREADRGFFKAMLRDVKRLHWSLRLPALIEAGVFYLLVWVFGRWQFDYGPYHSLVDMHLVKLNKRVNG